MFFDRVNDKAPYMSFKKGRNVNCGYALVDENFTNPLVFASVRDAEGYCFLNGLNPDFVIRTDNEESLYESKRIANAILPTLDMLREEIRAVVSEEYKVFADAIKKRNDEKGLLERSYAEQAKEEQGILIGLGMAEDILNRYRVELNNIIYHK